jgi:flagellar biosynthesis protein FlhG
MSDQANDLRQLVLRAQRPAPTSASPPKLVVVTSGKGGVGTTTLAVNLAIALARDGRRAVLVDADLDGADAGTLCRIEDPTHTIADILSGRLSVHEALVRGPGGIQVLPGAWGRDRLIDCSEPAQQRLLSQLKCLGAYADFVILDAGSRANRVAGQFWQAADHILLVTTTEVVSIMDGYAAVKILAGTELRACLQSVVNLAPSAAAAADVHQRLGRACRRFLGLKLSSAGHVPCDARVSTATAAGQPVLLEYPDCEAALYVEQLAQHLTSPVEVACRKLFRRTSSAARRTSA